MIIRNSHGGISIFTWQCFAWCDGRHIILGILSPRLGTNISCRCTSRGRGCPWSAHPRRGGATRFFTFLALLFGRFAILVLEAIFASFPTPVLLCKQPCGGIRCRASSDSCQTLRPSS